MAKVPTPSGSFGGLARSSPCQLHIPEPVSPALMNFLNIYLFLAALGLCCRMQAFSRWEPLLVEVRRLVTAVASLVEHRLSVHRLSCPPPHMGDLPGPGNEPVSPALAGRFLTIRPPGNSPLMNFLKNSVQAITFAPTAP